SGRIPGLGARAAARRCGAAGRAGRGPTPRPAPATFDRRCLRCATTEDSRWNWRATSRRLLPYALVAAGGFLLAYLLVAFVIFPPQIVPDDAKVPQVVGLLFDEAVTRLEAAGFKAKTGEERFVELAPQCTVLEHSPPPGATEPRGTEILLDVSAGQRQVQVPSVVGLAQVVAEDAIEKAGLEVGDVKEQESPAARG